MHKVRKQHTSAELELKLEKENTITTVLKCQKNILKIP